MQRSRVFLFQEDYHRASIRIPPHECPSLAKPEPARDATLGLRGLPLHCLIESINGLIEFFFRIILALVELRSCIVLELFEFGLGLAHFGGDSLVGLMDLLADIVYLYVDSLSAENNQAMRGAGKQASIRCDRFWSPRFVPILRLASSLLRQRCSGPSTTLWRFQHHL